MRIIRLGLAVVLGAIGLPAGLVLLGFLAGNVLADHFVGWDEYASHLSLTPHSLIVSAIVGAIVTTVAAYRAAKV